MSKILSIIIPAYNIEKYIEKCLKSMLLETILEDIEIIVVNDGSNDKTAEVTLEYVEKYPQTVKLINKENGGHGSTINTGIQVATGKYFKVVDGDDWLNTENLEIFVQLLKVRNEDVIANSFCCVRDETYEILSEKLPTTIEDNFGKVVCLGKEKITDVIKMHALTIRTAILKENNIKLDENCFYVDCEYIAYPFVYVETIYYDKPVIYMYRLGRNGQSMDIKSMQRNRNMHMRVLKSLLSFYDQLPQLSREKKQYIERVIAQVVENQFQIYISMGLDKSIQKELRDWDKNICAEYPKIAFATKKKSIDLLRRTDYKILPIGYWVLKMVKGF